MSIDSDNERPAEREHFGEAELGEAQSSNPPADPEMLRDEDGEGEEEPGAGAEGGAERYGGDQDAEPSQSGAEPAGED